MLRIVLPSAIGRQGRGAIASADICVAIEVVVAVDVDVVAAPTAVPAITSAPERSHRHTDTKGESHPSCVISWRRIIDRRIRVRRGAPHHRGIVRRYVNDFRTCRLDYNHAFVIDRLCFYLLLLGRLQIALLLGLLPHALYSGHHIALLGKERIPQISSPLNIVGEPFRHVWNSRKRLDACVPRLLRNCVGCRLTF